ncbi:hypothetical protein NMY22_g11171 [Coprinellus aureogranulatus]|nr:hypothetical protein NMY22_g11171 [Coprinellus aureogranulatus]
MREVDDQAATLQPFLLARGDELVDDNSGLVEITGLSFSDGDSESIGQTKGVTELEAESTKFAEGLKW